MQNSRTTTSNAPCCKMPTPKPTAQSQRPLKQPLMTETMRSQQQPPKPKFQVAPRVNTNLKRPEPPKPVQVPAKSAAPAPPRFVRAKPVSRGANFLSSDVLRKADSRQQVNDTTKHGTGKVSSRVKNENGVQADCQNKSNMRQMQQRPYQREDPLHKLAVPKKPLYQEKPPQKTGNVLKKQKLKAEEHKRKVEQLRKETELFDRANVDLNGLPSVLWRKRVELYYRDVFDGDSSDNEDTYKMKINAAQNYMVQQYGSYRPSNPAPGGAPMFNQLPPTGLKIEAAGKAIPRDIIEFEKQIKLLNGAWDMPDMEPNAETGSVVGALENMKLCNETQQNGMRNMGGGDGTRPRR